MSVHDQPDFARVYDEDEMILVRKGDLRALLDVASSSMDFASGFLNDEEVEILRGAAITLGIDPLLVTPGYYVCKFKDEHSWVVQEEGVTQYGSVARQRRWCRLCHRVELYPESEGQS